MKLETNMQIRNHKDLKYLLMISLATLYLWRPLLDLVLQWEGYMYLIPDTNKFFSKYINNIGEYYTYFNFQGMLLGDIITRTFGTHMKLYFAFEIGSILLTNIAIFFLVKTLLKNSFAAFLATIIFASNYFALAGIHLPNLYAGVFLERLPINIPLMIGSFILLHKYLEQNKVRLYLFSVVMFVIAIFISHYSIFLAFPFFCYPFFFRLYRFHRFKDLVLSLLLALPYVFTVLFFISNGTAPSTDISLFEFLLSPQINSYPEQMIRQLVYISQIPIVIKALFSGSGPLAFSIPNELTPFILPTLIAYLTCFVFVYKKMKQYRALLFTILCATLAILFSNTFIAPRLNVLGSALSNRYFFIPSIFISIFWAIVLTTLFKRKQLIASFITIVFFVVNAITFIHHFTELHTSTRKTETINTYISQNITQFPKQSVIVVGPSREFGPYDADFFTYHLGRFKHITFVTEGYGDWYSLASNSAHLIYLNFDEDCNCINQMVVK